MNKNRTKKQILFAIALALTLTFSAFAASMLSVNAQATTPTPEQWINLITQTAGGAWRPVPGITNYPWISQQNSENLGTNSPGPLTSHVLWRSDIALNPTVAQNGTVYTGEYAVDANTGEILWTNYEAGRCQGLTKNFMMSGQYSGPTGSHPNDIAFLIDRRTGQKVWTAPNGSNLNLILYVPAGIVFPRQAAVFANQWDPNLFELSKATICYGLDEDSGAMTLMWNSSNILSSRGFAYNDGKLYGADRYSYWISCVNATTGDLIWNHTETDPTHQFYSCPVVTNDKVYMNTQSETATPSNTLVVLDANTGNFLWKYSTGGDYIGTVAVKGSRAYLVGGSDCALFCLDSTNGNLIWTFEAPGAVAFYLRAVTNDAVYFSCPAIKTTGYPLSGTFPGKTYCVNAITGKEIWEYQTPTAADISGPFVADGNLYQSDANNYGWCWGAGPTTTDILVTSSQFTAGTSIVISGSVTDMSPFSQQHPELQSPCAANVPVVLSYVKDGTWTDFATVNTASDGTYMYTWAPPSEGAYKVVARFEGNEAYHWSSARTTVQVTSAPSAAPSPTATPPASATTPTNSPSAAPTPPGTGPNADIYLIAAAAAVLVIVIAVATIVFMKKRK